MRPSSVFSASSPSCKAEPVDQSACTVAEDRSGVHRSCSARGQRHDWDTVTPPDSGFRCGETMTYQPLRLIGRSDRPTNRSCESAGHSLVQRSDLLLNSYRETIGLDAPCAHRLPW